MADDEIGSAYDVNNAQNSTAPPRDDRLVIDEQRKPAEGQTTDKDYKPHEAETPAIPVIAWHWFRDKWADPFRPRGNYAEHLTVFFTFVIAVIGAFQAVIYYQQKRIMESSSGQTQQLITAANIQASAGNQIAEASKRNAKAAEDFSLAAQKQSDSLGKLVTTVGTGVGVQVQLARPRLEINLIGIHREGEKIFAIVRLENDGPTEATHIAVAAKIAFAKPKISDYKFGPNDYRPVDKIRLPKFTSPSLLTEAPGITLPERIPAEKYPVYRAKNLYIWGEIEFWDESGNTKQTIVQFCKFASGEEVLNSNSYATPNENDCLPGKNRLK